MKTIDDIKLSKLGNAIEIMLKDFLHLKNGDKIKTITEYSIKNDFSKGTYFNALAIIEENKLAVLNKKGHVGTIISSIDYEKIIVFLGRKNISIAMPYPRSIVLKRTATALSSAKINENMNLFILFSRGSKKRTELLTSNIVDAILLSNLSLTILKEKGVTLKGIYSIDKKLHNENVCIYIRKGEKDSIWQNNEVNVLYDNNSYDIKYIINTLFGEKNANFIVKSYTQSLELLREKFVDLIVHGEIEKEEIDKYDVEKLEIKDEIHLQMLGESSLVTLVCREDDVLTEKIITNFFQKQNIEENIELIIKGSKRVEF